MFSHLKFLPQGGDFDKTLNNLVDGKSDIFFFVSYFNTMVLVELLVFNEMAKLYKPGLASNHNNDYQNKDSRCHSSNDI